MSRDNNRPKKFKSHAPLDNVQSICVACQNSQHNKCTGFSVARKVKCLCKDVFDHEM